MSGFTLVEVLASVIIGGLIVASVLGIMNDVIRDSKEEEVRMETQKDMTKALGFIEDELKSAAYIYTGEELYEDRSQNIGPLVDYLDLPNDDDYIVVLAFWKPQVIPYTPAGAQVPLECNTGNQFNDDLDNSLVLGSNPSDEDLIERCEELQVERRTYTLVVYVQDTTPTNTWSGETVIRRFEMRKFENDSFQDGQQNYLKLKRKKNRPPNDDKNIYIDPVKEADGFRKWPFDINGNNLQANQANFAPPKINGNSSPVLVDFVDNETSDPGNLPTCLNEDSNGNNRLDTGEDLTSNGGNGNGVLDVYSLTPLVPDSDPPERQSNSFFACVRESALIGDIVEGNQDVQIYLRGNPQGRSGFEINPNSYKPLPTVQTQVVLRGVVDKFFND